MRAFAILLTFALQAQPARPAMTAANQHIAVNAEVSEGAVSPGSRVTVAFDISPRRRIHVYAPGAEYQVIDIKIDPQPGVTVHSTVYPPSETYHFVPLDEKVPVYMKPFRLTRDITIAKNGAARQALERAGTLAVTGKLEYQACDDKVCFKPAAVPFKFELKVKPAAGS